MEKLKLQANTLKHRVAHVSQNYGRERAKYQFDLVVQSVENLPDLRSGTTGILISCARGPKLAVTTQTDPAESKASWDEKLSFVCTMYDARVNERRWTEKLYRVSVQAVMPGEFGTHKKKLKEIAYTEIDVAQYANAGEKAHKQLTLRLGWTGKPLCYALLRVDLACHLVRVGGSTSDLHSISSNLTDQGEQSLDGFDETEGVRRAAAAHATKIGSLSSIRETLTSRLSRHGQSPSPARAGSDSERAWEDEEPAAHFRPAHAAHAAPPALHGTAPGSGAQPSRGHSRTLSHGSSLPPPPAPPPRAPPTRSAELEALEEAEAEAERLRDLLGEAAEGRERSQAEAGHLREQVRTLTLALQEAAQVQQAAASSHALAAAAGRSRSQALRESEEQSPSAAFGEQLRVNSGLRAALVEAESAREEMAKELERAQHVVSKLRLALDQQQLNSHEGHDEIERTELQLALVDAKMSLAQMEFEREEAIHKAIHKVRSLKQELERTTGGNLKVSKEMTWLEVKYTEARAELAKVKVEKLSLEDDLREVIQLKLELAEAQQRIAELEDERDEY
ncbi:hypothetical protein T492DRAFT_887512 [Pavlovales sp. CCMP2436]|nr:hypothetical protein T492DRAFT_887512 [Pavlovales sp. CCMP2436]